MVCKWVDLCPLRRFERFDLLDQRWANEYGKADTHWKACRRYQLEEDALPHPDNLLPDGRIWHDLDDG